MRKALLSLFVMMAVTFAAVPARAADVDGKWAGSVDTPMGSFPVAFTFKADGATLTGSQTGMDGAELPIKNGKIDGDKISFVVTLDFGGMSFDLNYTGVVKPEEVALTIDVMGMPMSLTVKRPK
jgi:hypothetical protein